ncbi:leucyl aminopeptidase [Rubinisphaera margarita]|uniref:leucyl aminopeptidase n=1 Tax=Rubinisphaera margarita TaxID=2909586 RepID=UPI001EE8A9D8|nr:leucyl aminopeptidase [Rubinisphaera margarita]MCG6157654.1 leucyl aminopeptidase [Rubinisphaera margarita]
MEIRAAQELSSDEKLDGLVLFISNGSTSAVPQQLAEAVEQLLPRLLESDDMPKKAGETRLLYGQAAPLPARVLLVGMGKADASVDNEASRFKAFCTAARALCDKADRNIAWVLPGVENSQVDQQRQLELAAAAIEVGVLTQGVYQQEKKKFPYQSVQLLNAGDNADQAVANGRILGQSINITRDLINRCASEVTPTTFADRAASLAGEVGLTCQIFDEAQLQKEKMGSMLAVAKGSDQPPRMVKLEYKGAGDAPFISLIGKGVTYDSGGLSIKPSDSMKTMKSDMSGAATVLGIMHAVAALKLPINVRGYCGLVENMISGRSYRVGDILTARNGTTIEVLNTDAEGRLVLADVLSYAVDDGCEKMIDFATLTGSCVVALGEDYSGLFTNSQDWCDELVQAAETTGEKVWQLPMCDSFNDQLKSDVADCRNVGARWGGAITAAKFLEKFVSETPWIHCDIAGPAFRSESKPERDGGATGVLLRTVLELLKKRTA